MYNADMFYILGLGNPGEKYDGTRHNVGRDILKTLQAEGGFSEWEKNKNAEALFARGALANTPVELFLPETFMNQSGKTARYLTEKAGATVDSLVVVHDEVDLPLGEIKVSVGRGAGGNNGVESVIQAVGKDFVRLRIGVARRSFWTGKTERPSGSVMSRYVLGKFTRGEQAKLAEVANRVREALGLIVEQGIEKAMNEYNQ